MNFDFPLSESIIIYIGFATIFLGLIMFVILVYQTLKRSFSKKEDEKEKPSPGCLIQLIKVLLITLLVMFGFTMVFLGAFIQSFTAFTKEELVAEVLCQEIKSSEYSMKLVLIEKKGRNANIYREFFLNGDQWFIRGDIIKWDDWVNFLGLHTMYKLTRIGGYFTNPKNESELRTTHYSLTPEEQTPFWRWLYKNGYKLPLINDVYGNSVYKYPAIYKVFKVYVTTSGFSIETENGSDN